MSQMWRLAKTLTTQCGFCREPYEVGNQRLTPDADALPLNQCSLCARQEARGSRERAYPMFDRRPDKPVTAIEERSSVL